MPWIVKDKYRRSMADPYLAKGTKLPELELVKDSITERLERMGYISWVEKIPEKKRKRSPKRRKAAKKTAK